MLHRSGSDLRGLERLEDYRPLLLRRIVIPSFHVRDIKQELIDTGIDEATIFPDLDGLGRAIATAYTLTSDPLPHSRVFSRLAPSKAYPGQVGVFALRQIKRDDHLFRGENEEIVWLDKTRIENLRMLKSARNLYKDFSVARNGFLGCPTSFNRLTVAWYLKQATPKIKANVRPDRYYEFYALREELIAEFLPAIHKI